MGFGGRLAPSTSSQKIRLPEARLRTKPGDEAWLVAKKQRKAIWDEAAVRLATSSAEPSFCLSAASGGVAAAGRLPRWLMQAGCRHRAALPPSMGSLLSCLACPTQTLSLGVTRVLICARAGESSPRFSCARHSKRSRPGARPSLSWAPRTEASGWRH